MKKDRKNISRLRMVFSGFSEAAECLRVLAHPQRLVMIDLLLSSAYTVGELADRCGIPSHFATQHLRLMERCKLLRRRRKGRSVYYSVNDPGLAVILRLLRKRFRIPKLSYYR